jgi:hypothetical protein
VIKLPVLLASSVIRSTYQGESHGGLYLVNSDTGEHEVVLDWNDGALNWEGRGGDRGLRGIAFHKGLIYLAASNEILVYDKNFKRLHNYKNAYLGHCHEISVCADRLFVTSTMFNSILEIDLIRKQFVKGYRLRRVLPLPKKLCRTYPLVKIELFDPNTSGGPDGKDLHHINSVIFEKGICYICGTGLKNLLGIEGTKLFKYARVPGGTHNCRPYKDGILFNNTRNECVCFQNRKGATTKFFPIKRYDYALMKHTNVPEDHARQAFSRGLCLLPGDLLAVGSSPATISIYDFDKGVLLKSINLSMDIRNAIHGLEVWPF